MNKTVNIFLIFSLLFVVSCKKEHAPPTCLITSPQENQEFYENEDIRINVTANGGDSDIAYVHLYINNLSSV